MSVRKSKIDSLKIANLEVDTLRVRILEVTGSKSGEGTRVLV